jgi:N-acetylglucosamine kinase-like BadF-type ATPase
MTGGRDLMGDSGGGALPAVLAIDGGNSKTDVALVGADGTLLASVRGPGASQEIHGVEGAMRIIDGLVRAVLVKAGLIEAGFIEAGFIEAGLGRAGLVKAGADGACLIPPESGIVARHTSACLAGADLPEEEAALTAALLRLGWSTTAVAVNDTFAVFRAGLGWPELRWADGTGRPWGVAVTCGAGINCVAVAPDGRTARYLALGTLTGDWGGGWGLGHAVMWHCMRAEDGRGPATALTGAVAKYFGMRSVSDVAIAVHKGQLTEDDLLGLAPVLFALAADGDQVARSLVERQAEEICVMAVTALRRLGLPAQGTPVVLGGGLLVSGDALLTGAVRDRLAAAAPGALLRVVDIPPVAGAALLGLDYLDADPAAMRRLAECYRTAS